MYGIVISVQSERDYIGRWTLIAIASMSGGEGIEMQGIVSSTAINTPPPLVTLSLRKSE